MRPPRRAKATPRRPPRLPPQLPQRKQLLPNLPPELQRRIYRTAKKLELDDVANSLVRYVKFRSLLLHSGHTRATEALRAYLEHVPLHRWTQRLVTRVTDAMRDVYRGRRRLDEVEEAFRVGEILDADFVEHLETLHEGGEVSTKTKIRLIGFMKKLRKRLAKETRKLV